MEESLADLYARRERLQEQLGEVSAELEKQRLETQRLEQERQELEEELSQLEQLIEG